MFGLLERDIEMILKALQNNNDIERALIFGSRAMGNYKKGSDMDIAIFGEEVTKKTVANLNELLNEVYLLPYFFDLLHYEGIMNDNLKEHIDKVGIEIYAYEDDLWKK